MSADAWLTLAVSIVVLVLLTTDRFQPALVMGGGVTVLLVAGVIDQDQALLGFSNDAPITVAALYVLAGAAEVTGALDNVTARVLGRSSGAGESLTRERALLARIGFPSMTASAFIANTPLVGMLAPRVLAWCRQTGRSPSRYLMPLSYMVIFGGCMTLIGTSTNLVVSGLLRETQQRPFDLFEITPAGVPIALVGVALTVLLSPRLLARREGPDQLSDHVKEFTVEMVVAERGPLVGRSVAEAGLRNLEGVFLIGIERADEMITPVAPTEGLRAQDRLVFAGNVTRIVDLQRMAGLTLAAERHFTIEGDRIERRFYEAVVGAGSGLAGSTLKRAQFRSHYAAAVVAIHRAGERLPGKLGEVRLRPGDVLLLIGGPDLPHRLRDHPDLHLLVPSTSARPVRRERARIVQLLALGLVVVAGTGLLDLLETSLIVAVLIVGLGVLTPGEARNAIDLDIILLMATSFGLGIAIGESGLAEQLANGIVAGFEPFGDVGLLAGILIATMLLTELLSNNAAAVLMFPIAMATAAQSGLQPRPFAAVILFGASLSFLTPIGYQANTLVWGLGGYRYRDFSRLGAPLTLATIVMVLIMVPVVFPLR